MWMNAVCSAPWCVQIPIGQFAGEVISAAKSAVPLPNYHLSKMGLAALGHRRRRQAVAVPVRLATDFCTKYIAISETIDVVTTM